MKAIAVRILQTMARRVLAKYHPIVIGVTGSYGKTSTKEAIAAALSPHYHVRRSPRSYNNELGVPFTVLGIEIGSSGLSAVCRAWWSGVRLLMQRQSYPTVLILEFGDDRPGDIERLLNIAPLDIGVLTSIGPTHLARFQTVENVFAEESKIITSLSNDAWAILNCDDLRVRDLAEVAMCRIVSYGYSGYVAVRAVDLATAKDSRGQWGTELTVQFQHQVVPVFLPGVLGRQSGFAALAAFSVGVALKLDLVEIVEGLRNYTPPPGRMRLLPGVHGSMIIDDSYNSSPDACTAAIEALRFFPAEGKRYAVLGDMADLGAVSEPAHRGMGKDIVDNEIDVFVTVGQKMKLAAIEAERLGLPKERIISFEEPLSAATYLKEHVQSGDAILLKGSQVARMEKAVQAILAEPASAPKVLVRHDRSWRRK